MLPDLRFLIGAVLATVLLGVTAYGVTATMRIASQTKVGLLETSRMLPDPPDRRRGDALTPASGPFAAIPAEARPADLRSQPAEPTLLTAANTASETVVPALSDADTVDERAVVDPPLPLDTEPQSSAAELPAESSPAIESIAPAEATPAVPAVIEGSGVPPASHVDHVGSVTATPAIASTPSREETPKAKRATRKASIAKRKARRTLRTIAPLASTGYAVNVGSQARASRVAPARGASRPLWTTSD